MPQPPPEQPHPVELGNREIALTPLERKTHVVKQVIEFIEDLPVPNANDPSETIAQEQTQVSQFQQEAMAALPIATPLFQRYTELEAILVSSTPYNSTF